MSPCKQGKSSSYLHFFLRMNVIIGAKIHDAGKKYIGKSARCQFLLFTYYSVALAVAGEPFTKGSKLNQQEGEVILPVAAPRPDQSGKQLIIHGSQFPGI